MIQHRRSLVGASIRALPIVLVLTLCASAQAEDPPTPQQVSVRLTVVKGIGKIKKDTKPSIPSTLQSVKGVLTGCGYDRYDFLQAPVKRGVAKATFAFDALPAGHSATITWEPSKSKGDIVVIVTINKTTPKGTQKVASMKVRLRDGKSYLVKRPKAYADGDLLLVVTVSRKAFPKKQ